MSAGERTWERSVLGALCDFSGRDYGLVVLLFKPLCLLSLFRLSMRLNPRTVSLSECLALILGLIKCMYCGWEIDGTVEHAACIFLSPIMFTNEKSLNALFSFCRVLVNRLNPSLIFFPY